MESNKQTQRNSRSNLEPGKPGPGRPKGSLNRSTAFLRDLVLAVNDKLDEADKGLEYQALKNPEWFLEHFLKPMLPKNIDIGPADGKGLNWNITIRDPKDTAAAEEDEDNEDFLL